MTRLEETWRRILAWIHRVTAPKQCPGCGGKNAWRDEKALWCCHPFHETAPFGK